MENKTDSFEIDLILLFLKITKTVTDNTDTISGYIFSTTNE